MFQKGANLTSEFLYKDNEMIDIEDGIDIFDLYTLKTLLHSEFTLIEEELEEIDIQKLENIIDYRTSEDDLYNDNFSDFAIKINELIKAVKQIDRKIGGNNK